MAPKAKQAARRAKAEAKAETGSNARNAARIVDNLPPLVTRKSTEVPVVCDMGLVEGIRLGRLVPLCAELVMETAAQGEADQEVALGLPDKARAAAAWICANNIERTIVFCSHQAEADEFALCLDPCVQEFSAEGCGCAPCTAAPPASDRKRSSLPSRDVIMCGIVVG